jgi:hypothetical protein
MDDKKKTKHSDAQETPTMDVSLIEYNLSLTPEERIINHQGAFETFQELVKARKHKIVRQKVGKK